MVTCYIQQQLRNAGNLAPGDTVPVYAADFIRGSRPHVQAVYQAQQTDICHAAAMLAEVRFNRSDELRHLTLRVHYEGIPSNPCFVVTVY